MLQVYKRMKSVALRSLIILDYHTVPEYLIPRKMVFCFVLSFFYLLWGIQYLIKKYFVFLIEIANLLTFFYFSLFQCICET
jgi:hypothetical protein